MQVTLSDLKINVGKYVELAETTDVIITKYGKPTAKIIRFDKAPWHLKQFVYRQRRGRYFLFIQ